MERIDAHVHYALPLEPEKLMELLERTGTRRAALVLVPHTRKLSCTPEALLAKSKYPDRLWVLTSLDPSAYYLFPKTFGKHIATKLQSSSEKCIVDAFHHLCQCVTGELTAKVADTTHQILQASFGCANQS